MNKKEYFILFVVTIIFALSIYFYFNNNVALSPVGNICTDETQTCPDGSVVSRVSPNCDFAACPEIKQATSSPQ